MVKVNYEIIEEVLEVIENVKLDFMETELYTEYDIEPEYYFTRGGCGQFYTILKSAFPQAKPILTEGAGHVITEIDGILYDVKGIYEKDDISNIEITNALEKIITNFAFSLRSRSFWGGENPGPTNVCFLQAIDEMEEDEREAVFELLDEYDIDFFRAVYDEFLYDEYEKEELNYEADYCVFYDQVA